MYYIFETNKNNDEMRWLRPVVPCGPNMTKVNNIYTSLASQSIKWQSGVTHFKNHILSSYAAVLQDVTQLRINEPSSEIIHQKVPLTLSIWEYDFKYHLEPTR